ncbi:MAG: Beta sliding clamp [Patescibacteria group bacterium]|nr:Beta sliding clamp [Patescibacteria group bacterium]
MKLICTQENFKKAIYSCERMVSKQNTLPILNNILFEAQKNKLSLSATNLEIGVQAKIGAKVEKEGKITIPARIISNFSNNLPAGENISLELSGQSLKIKSGAMKVVIKGLLADDFPLIPKKKADSLLEISGVKLKTVLSRVLTSVARNEARQELTGINLILGQKELFFASTDSFRLAEERLVLDKLSVNKENYEIFSTKNGSLIIPSATLAEISRIISGDTDTPVKITIEEGQIFFELENIIIVSRLINGKYPEYRHIMPKEYKTRIVGEKGVFQSAVKMASIFASGKTGEITIKIDAEAKKVLVSSMSQDTGENSTELNFDITGPSQEVVLSSKYLLEGINTVSTSKLALLINSESTPLALREINEQTGEVLEDYTYIVMPIKN